MCKCGCNKCEVEKISLTEEWIEPALCEELIYHLQENIPIYNSPYLKDKEKFKKLVKEVKKLYSRKMLNLSKKDEALIRVL